MKKRILSLLLALMMVVLVRWVWCWHYHNLVKVKLVKCSLCYFNMSIVYWIKSTT